MEETNQSNIYQHYPHESTRAQVREAIPGRFDRLRFYGKAFLVWNHIMLQNVTQDISDYHNDEELATSQEGRISAFSSKLGRWAFEKGMLSPVAKEQYIARHPEVAES